MKILIIDTYYDKFINSFHKRLKTSSETLNFEELREMLLNQSFGGVSNFYSKNLKSLGVEAETIIFNDKILQAKWLEMYGKGNFKKGFDLRSLSKADRVLNYSSAYKILNLQIDFYKPDVLYINSPAYFGPIFLNSAKKKVKLLVGQIASKLPPVFFFKPYDLMISTLPNQVEFFKKHNINAECLKLGFEASILEKIESKEKKYPITFVGSFAGVHDSSIFLFEEVAKNFKDFYIWGHDFERVKSDILKDRYKGEAWGLDMYNVLSNSLITLNRHGFIEGAGKFATNLRLFEATGVGTMLITDQKDTLGELFKVGEELETYASPLELIEKIKYYLENESARKKIAEAGQKRTLLDHTYRKRMEELLVIINKYI